jgi:serine/threonine-protein kinase
MAITSVADLVGAVSASRLLESAQQDVLKSQLQRQFSDPKALARALVERGWMTPFQIKAVASGRGNDLFIGQYVLLDALGEGGMGQVFKARHRALGRTVALKVIRQEWLSKPDAVRRFQREIRAAAQLNHPNIVLALDADQMGQTHFIAMEYVDGIDLSKLVKQSGPLPASQAADYAYQAALGLQHAHERGLVHRDIKPSNLLVTQDANLKKQAIEASRKPGQPARDFRWGLVKVLDMGVARATQSSESDLGGTLTHAGAVLGTPDYISPEQARDSRTADIRSDVYSLGCTLYFMLTGQVPFPGGTGMEKIFKHQLETAPPVTKLRSGIPAGLSKVVTQWMAKKPEDRPQTPAAAAQALLPFLQAGKSSGIAPLQIAAGASADALDPTLPSKQPEDSTPHIVPGKRRTSGLAPRGEVRIDDGPSRPSSLRRRLLWIAGLGGVSVVALLLVVGAAAFFGFGGTSTDGKHSIGNLFSSNKPVLDRLESSQIPSAERLPNLPPEIVAVLGEHRFRHWGPVQGAAFSPDGKWLATVGGDRQIRIWNLVTGEQRGSWPSEAQGPVAGAMVSLAYSANGQALIMYAIGQYVHVHDTGSGKITQRFPNAKVTGRPMALSAAGDTVAFVNPDGTVVLWDVVQGKELGKVAGIAPNGGFVLSRDGKTMVTGFWAPGDKAELKVLDVATGEQRLTLPPAKSRRLGAALSADGQQLAVVTDPSTLHIYETSTGKELLAREMSNRLFNLVYAPTGKTLAIAAMDGVHLFDIATGQEKTLTAMGGHAGNSGMTFAPDGRTLATTGGFEPVVHLWDVASGQELRPSEGHGGFGSQALLTPDSASLVTGGGWFGSRSGIKVWDIGGGKVRRTLTEPSTGPGNFSMLLALSADGQSVLTRSNNAITLWDVAGGTQKASVQTGAQQMFVAAASLDGSTVFAFHQAGKIWDGATLKERCTLEGMKAPTMNQVALSADGKRLVAGEFQGGGGGGPGRIRLWDATTGKEINLKLPAFNNGIQTVAISRDGQTIAASGIDATVKLWDTATGKERLSYQEAPGPKDVRVFGFMLQFSPDNQTLAAWHNQSLHLWDTATGKERCPAKSVKDGIISGAFTANGKLLATSDRTGRITVWNVTTGNEIQHVQLPGPASSLLFAGDNRHLISSNANGTIYILRLTGQGS